MAQFRAPTQVDIHEILKRQAFAAPYSSCDEDHFERNRPGPKGVYGVSDQYMILDTFVKLPESDISRGEFRWNFIIQGSTSEEALGVNDKIDNVIQIQLGTFSMPILPEVQYTLQPAPVAPTGTDQLVLIQNNNNAVAPFSPTLVPNVVPYGQYPPSLLIPPNNTIIPWVNNPYTQFPFFDRFTIQLREAGLQSYSDRNGARHHFEYFLSTPTGIVSTNPNMLLAMPHSRSQWDTYTFTDPLTDVHGLTLIFRNPDIPMRFLPDCLYDVTLESDAAAAPGPFLRINAPGHNLNMGDRVFIKGCRTGNNRLDTYINRPEGHVAAGDPSLPPLAPGVPIVLANPNLFYLDPAISIIDLTVQVPVLPQIVTVCIAKRRMCIPIRFRRIIPGLTNYIIPSH
jgi:hypothetical protein